MNKLQYRQLRETWYREAYRPECHTLAELYAAMQKADKWTSIVSIGMGINQIEVKTIITLFNSNYLNSL